MKQECKLAEAAGKMLYEAFEAKGTNASFKEKYFKEDMDTTTAAGAYTTMLSGVLYQAAIDRIQPVLDLVKPNNDMVNSPGYGAYKIPLDQPTVAVEVSEGAVVNYFDEGVDSITVTPRKIVAGTAITWEIMKRGMNDFVKITLNKAANAISRKLASDIVNGLAAGADSGNTVTGGMDYNAIIDAEANVNQATYSSNSTPYGFMANKLVFNGTTWGTLQKDTDFKNTVYRAGAKPGETVLNTQPLMFGDMEIIKTPFLTAALGLVLDSEVAAMLVKESELEVYEGQINGRPYDKELVALQSYVLAVLYGKAIAKITA